MSSLPSNSETASFGLLDERIQRWIWSQGWTSLRSVQEYAIPPLLSGTTDVILAAATSAGKTEAAFTRLLNLDVASRYILSISPLKAPINDQTQRLTPICELLDLPILGWHGDVPASRKQKFLRKMSGVLIITPESLEALFVNKGTAIPAFAKAAQCVVIDELHSFIGTERGKQVQSLLHRLEMAAERRMPRVGLKPAHFRRCRCSIRGGDWPGDGKTFQSIVDQTTSATDFADRIRDAEDLART